MDAFKIIKMMAGNLDSARIQTDAIYARKVATGVELTATNGSILLRVVLPPLAWTLPDFDGSAWITWDKLAGVSINPMTDERDRAQTQIENVIPKKTSAAEAYIRFDADYFSTGRAFLRLVSGSKSLQMPTPETPRPPGPFEPASVLC